MKTIINILLFSGIAAAVWVKYFQPEPDKPQVHLNLIASHDGIDRSEQIKQAFTELAAACPAVIHAKSIDVQYEDEEQTLWRAEKLGWKSDLYFRVDDMDGKYFSLYDGRTRPGEVHHFYIRQDGVKELLIDSKQSTLDMCRINAAMHSYYIMPL